MKTSSNLNKLFSLLLVFTMIFSMVSVQAFAAEEDDDPGLTWEKVDDQNLFESLIEGRKAAEAVDEKEPYDNEDYVRVSIFLDGESTIAAGYPAADIANNKKAMSYRSKLEMTQQRMESVIASAVNEKELDVVWNLTLAANVISANVRYGDIEKIEAVRGVKKVVIENQYAPCVVEDADEPNMAIASDMVGSKAAWASGYTGAGSRIAIIDTGADTDHQSLDAAAFEYSLKKNAELLGKDYDEYVKSLDLLDADEIASVLDKLNISYLSDNAEDYFVTSKIAFGANYIDSTFIIDHDHDSQGGHGSHVTGIAAANKYIPDGVDENENPKFKTALDSVMVEGNAPDAQILTMKVFGAKGGAYDSDYMAAIEDAIVLGADSVNLSLGSSSAGFSFADDYEDVMDAITESGTTVCISAGNSYSWANYTTNKYLYKDGVNFMTSGSPGSFTNSFTVASVGNDGTRANYFKFNDEDRLYNYTAMNTRYANAFTTIAGDHEYVMLDPSLADKEADSFAAIADVVNGKVAMSWRGSVNVGTKANAAVEAGAIATILCNNQSGTYSASNTGYKYKLPVATITQVFGNYVLASSEKHETADGLVYYTGKIYISATAAGIIYNSEYLTMSSFSSWGVPENLELEPEITAPGGTIYSLGVTAGGKSYTNMSGTSMAAPQISGLSAVLGQYIRENDLEDKTGRTERQLVQSLLMSTAVPMLDANSKYYYPVIQQGAGLARVDLAIGAHSYIWMDKDATVSYFDGKVKAELGEDPERTGKYSFSFSINNMTDEARSYELSADMFTQAIRQDQYLDRLATALNAVVTWTVDGNVLDPEVIDELLNCDFDGDGNIDTDDGQALLDWFVGNREEIFNAEYADLDEDGDIDTYDAYLFFLGLSTGSVIVPAGGSTEVKVDIELLNIADFDFNGAYVEGYVFAKEVLSADGVEGDAHSIPVLAYYGGWNEASMFDLGTQMDYEYKNETRRPYLYSYNGYNGNFFGVTYAGEEDEYYFGGNPVVYDDEWLKERDAINSDDAISSINYTLVRNASNVRVYAKNSEGEEVYSEELGKMYAAYYYQGWMSSQFHSKPAYDLKNVKEGDYVTLGLQAMTGFEVNEAADWSKALPSNTYEMTMRIDNTAPVVTNVSYRETTSTPADPEEDDVFTKTINLTVQDNQYIAGVVVADENGKVLGYVGGDSEQAEGAKFDVAVDVTGYNGTKFLVEVSDYAFNTTSYKVNLDKEEARGEIAVEVTPKAAEIIVGAKQKLDVTVTPWGTADGTVTWSSSDEKVATVNEKGIVTAVGEGKALITATSNSDPTKFDSCEVTCIILNYTMYGELQDIDGTPLTFTWDISKAGSSWNMVAEASSTVQAAAASGKKGFYYNICEGAEIELVNFETGIAEASWKGSAEVYDASLSAAFEEDHLWGTNGTYLYTPVAVTAGFTNDSRINISSVTENSALQGVASLGMVAENVERVAVINKNGNLWFIDYDFNAKQIVKAEKFATGMAGLKFPGYSGTPYNSLVVSDDGIFFMAYFDGDTNVMYRLQFNADTNSYKAKAFGDVGYNVWPAALIEVVSNAPASEGDAVAGTLNAVEDPEPIVIDDPELPVEPIDDEIELNYNSEVEISEEEDFVTLIVKAPADNTNGLVNVTYNAELLEYVSAGAMTDYFSVNADEEGIVKFDWVEVAGLEEGDTVAILLFKVKNTDDTEIAIDWTEINDSNVPEEEPVEPVDPPVEPVDPPVEPVEPDDPIEDEGNVETVKVVYDHDYDENGRCIHCGKERPKTGDDFSLIAWTLTFAIAAAGAVFMLKKRSYIG